METVWKVTTAFGMGIGLFYMGLATVVISVLLAKSFKNRGTVLTTVQQCPYCDGKGVIDTEDNDLEVCPLCDGESAIIVRLPAKVEE